MQLSRRQAIGLLGASGGGGLPKAQVRTGLPIFTHNPYLGTRETTSPTAAIPTQLAKRGVFVGFDRVTIPIVPDAQKVTTILAFLDAGYVDRLLLSSDFSNGRALKKNGGPGIAQTATVFGALLLKAGVGEATLRHILVDNPRRFLAFMPKAA